MWLVAKAGEDLADFVRRIRESSNPRLSTRDVAHRSGGLISHGYVSMIENRGVLGSGVGPSRLLGLARGLGRSLDEVIAKALGLEVNELAAAQSRLIGFFERLPEEKQSEALDFMEVLSRRYGVKPPTKKPKPRAA